MYRQAYAIGQQDEAEGCMKPNGPVSSRVSMRALMCSAALIAACNALTADSILRERQPGRITFHSDTVVLVVPDTVQIATPFEVAIRTYGDGCVDEGDTQVITSGSLIEVIPFDIFVVRAGPNHVCTDILRHFPHRTMLQFLTAGEATVRARGRAYPGDSVIFRDRTVVVR